MEREFNWWWVSRVRYMKHHCVSGWPPPAEIYNGWRARLGKREFLVVFTVCTAVPRLPPSSGQCWKIFYHLSLFRLFVCFHRNMEGKEVNSSFVVPKTLWDFEYIFQELSTKIYWTLKSGCLPFLTTAHLGTFLTLPLTILSPGKVFLCHPEYNEIGIQTKYLLTINHIKLS